MTDTNTKGFPYTLEEAKRAAELHNVDIYHKELILWLCDEIEKKNKLLQEQNICCTIDEECFECLHLIDQLKHNIKKRCQNNSK